MILKFTYKDKERLAFAPRRSGETFIQVHPEFGFRSFKPGLMMNIRDANFFERTFAHVRRWLG